MEKFGSVTVTKAVDGLGTSGICTSQLTFATPAPFNAYRAAEVVLTAFRGCLSIILTAGHSLTV